ncbi:MAG: hypothetical protein P8X82_16605 [Gemmatimonadales bacterium]
MLPVGLRSEFLGPQLESAEIVESRRVVHQTPFARLIGLELGRHICIESQYQLLGIDRIGNEVPGSGVQGGEPEIPICAVGTRHENGGTRRHPGLLAQGPAEPNPFRIGKGTAHEDEVGRVGRDPLQAGLGSVSTHHGIAVGGQNALE